jgi:hypothetical protein
MGWPGRAPHLPTGSKKLWSSLPVTRCVRWLAPPTFVAVPVRDSPMPMPRLTGERLVPASTRAPAAVPAGSLLPPQGMLSRLSCRASRWRSPAWVLAAKLSHLRLAVAARPRRRGLVRHTPGAGNRRWAAHGHCCASLHRHGTHAPSHTDSREQAHRGD